MTKKIRKQEELITPSEAMQIVSEEFSISVTSTTIRNWCKEYSVGKKVVGRWYVWPEKLRELLKEM